MIPEHLQPKAVTEPTKAGLDPAFCYADGYYRSALLDRIAETSGEALSDSEKHRLVEGSKSQTEQNPLAESIKSAQYKQELSTRLKQHRHQMETGESAAPTAGLSYNEHGHQITEVADHQREQVALNTPGTKAVFERRQWKDFDQFRIRTEVDTRPKVSAPEGQRRTSQLTRRAANKIADSCLYVAMERGGYSTFVTFTFNDAQREKIKNGDCTIQKEVTRALDGFKKVYERGMPKEGISPNNDEFDYCWVVEIPKNANGEDNPHVHLLMRWQVPHHQFKAWAARLENLWGHGFTHIEKIKEPRLAGAYMAKAAGYFTKAQGDGSQGEVKGNRYGISKSARAPGWETYSTAQMHVLGQLIADVQEHLENTYSHLYEKRRRLNKRREELAIDLKEAKKQNLEQQAQQLNKQRLAIGQTLSKVREEIQAIPIRSNGYQVVIEGQGHFYQFIAWAKGYEGHQRPEWLPEIPDAIHYKSGRRPTWEDAKDIHDLRKARRYRQYRQHALDDEQLAEMEQAYSLEYDSITNCWDEYAGEPIGFEEAIGQSSVPIGIYGH